MKHVFAGMLAAVLLAVGLLVNTSGPALAGAGTRSVSGSNSPLGIGISVSATYYSNGSKITIWNTAHASVHNYWNPVVVWTNIGAGWQVRQSNYGYAEGWADYNIGIPTPWGVWGWNLGEIVVWSSMAYA